MNYDFQNMVGRQGVSHSKEFYPWHQDTPPFTAEPVAGSSRGAPQARYLNSFLVTEQLESAAVVLGEGGDLEVKCWRPSLSLLGKRLGLKTELY